MAQRSLSLAEAEQRVTAQPPQSEKMRLADVVIDTTGELADTRRQVEAAWQAIARGGSHGQDRGVQGFASQTHGR
jgi:dephospho-CoA kinase